MWLNSLIKKEAPLNPNKLFATAMLNSLQTYWAPLVSFLGKWDSYTMDVVVRPLHNEIIKHSTVEDSMEVPDA